MSLRLCLSGVAARGINADRKGRDFPQGERLSRTSRQSPRQHVQLFRTAFLLFVLVLFVPILRAQDTPADNWSQFRGNSRNTGVSDSKVPTDLKLLWTFEAGDSIESSAAVVGGTVFVGSQKGELVSLNLDNGAVYWKYDAGNPIGESSPAYSDGKVYVGDLGGVLHAVSA